MHPWHETRPCEILGTCGVPALRELLSWSRQHCERLGCRPRASIRSRTSRLRFLALARRLGRWALRSSKGLGAVTAFSHMSHMKRDTRREWGGREEIAGVTVEIAFGASAVDPPATEEPARATVADHRVVAAPAWSPLVCWSGEATRGRRVPAGRPRATAAGQQTPCHIEERCR